MRVHAWIGLAGLVVGSASALAQQPLPENSAPAPRAVNWMQTNSESAAEDGSGPTKTGPSFHWNAGVQWRITANAANFGWHPVVIEEGEDTRRFVNQRFRTWVSLSPTDTVGGYLQVEIRHILWGQNAEAPKTFQVDGDSVGIDLRRGFLRYASPGLGVFRAGIQDWHDAFGESPTLGSFDSIDDYDSFQAVLANSVWDFNVGGLAWSRTFPSAGGLTVNAGIFQLWDSEEARADEAYLLALDGDLPGWSEGDTIGASIYYLSDRAQYSYPTAAPYKDSWDLWFGVRASKRVGSLPLRGWVILNTGRRDEKSGPDFRHTGWAAKIEAFGVDLGPGTLSSQVLYASGNDDPTDNDSGEFRTIAQSEGDNFGSQGYWSYLILSSPHGPSDVKDLGVGLQNRGLGLLTIQAKYDYRILGPLSGVTAAGWLRSAADNPTSGERDMGVEIAQAFRLDLGGGMTLDFGGAYFFTGDFYRAPGAGSPDDLWETFLRAQLEL